MNKPAPPPTRKALGRGLDALLRPAPSIPDVSTTLHDAPWVPLRQLPIAEISVNPFQPRRSFDETELAELAASIRSHGVLQPILVRVASTAGFELVAGERRLRAASLAGLTEIPAQVQKLSDSASLEIAIVENLQRTDLNPIEQAQAFFELGQRFHLTQEAIAEKTGKDRATIANFLRLLRLDAEVIELLRAQTLSPGQARPLLALSEQGQRTLARQIVEQNWSARRVEQHVARLQAPAPAAQPAPARDPNEREAELNLARALGTRVTLRPGRGGRGTIEIHYASLEEFQRIYSRMTGAVPE